MIIDRDHILKLADLAKINLSEDEIDSYISDINKIVELVSEVKDVDTEGIEPLSNVIEELSETREDVPSISVKRDEALENAPDSDGIYYQVPPTIKHNKEKDD
tara:strand:- start:605 stop:913 length:309 start_codon:yes stop_codon:yes gene_type:complete